MKHSKEQGTEHILEPDANGFSKHRIIKNLVVASLTFLMSFTASEGLAFLQSTMNKEVGLISFSVQYACGCIASLFLPKYLIAKYGSKLVLVISMFAYIPYLSSNFYPVFGFMIPTSIIVGFASSLIFNSLCTYVNDLAFLYSKLCLENECPDLDTQLHEKDTLKNKFTDSPKFYNSIRKHKDSILINKHSMFSESDSSLVIADTEDKEIALRKFQTGSPDGMFSKENAENSNLIVEQSKSDTLTNKVQKQHITSDLTIKETDENLTSTDYSIFSNGIDPHIHENKTNSNLNPVPKGSLGCSIEDRHDSLFSITSQPSDAAIKVLETTTSRFFGFFSCVYQMCHISSNVISHLIFQNSYEKREYSFNSSCVCGSEFCSMDSVCFLDNLQKPSTEIRYTLTTVYVGLSFLSALLTLIFLDNINSKNSKISFSWDIAVMTFKFHRNRNQLLLIPLSLYIGVIQAFVTGDFTKDFVGCAWGVEHVPLVMISMGCGISFFSFLYAVFEKHVGRYSFFFVASAINFATLATMLHWRPDPTKPAMFFMASGMLGALIGIMWCQTKAFIGIIFKEEEETAYGCYQLWHALGCAVVYAYNNYVCTYVKLYIMLTVSIFSAIGYFLAERDYSLSKKQRNVT